MAPYPNTIVPFACATEFEPIAIACKLSIFTSRPIPTEFEPAIAILDRYPIPMAPVPKTSESLPTAIPYCPSTREEYPIKVTSLFPASAFAPIKVALLKLFLLPTVVSNASF